MSTDPQAAAGPATAEQVFQTLIGRTAQLEIQLRQLSAEIEQAPFNVNKLAAHEGFTQCWSGILFMQRALQEHKIQQAQAQMQARAQAAQAEADAQLANVNANRQQQPQQGPQLDLSSMPPGSAPYANGKLPN